MGSNKAAVYKKRAAPRTPEVPIIYADLEKKSSLKKRPAPPPRKFDGIPSGSVNPIRELELIGKKVSEEVSKIILDASLQEIHFFLLTNRTYLMVMTHHSISKACCGKQNTIVLQ